MHMRLSAAADPEIGIGQWLGIYSDPLLYSQARISSKFFAAVDLLGAQTTNEYMLQGC